MHITENKHPASPFYGSFDQYFRARVNPIAALFLYEPYLKKHFNEISSILHIFKISRIFSLEPFLRLLFRNTK
jgi:hypothetical protein